MTQEEKAKIILAVAAEIFYQISTLDDIASIQKIAISQMLKIDGFLK